MKSPFSRDRLRELWFEASKVELILCLANAVSDEPVTESELKQWYIDAGIDIHAKPVIETVLPKQVTRKTRGETVSIPCDACGTVLTRYKKSIHADQEHVFCNRQCQAHYYRAHPAKRVAPIMPEKVCSRCHVIKPIGDFSKAKGRPDGHTHLCKVCNREKCKAAYEADREKAIARTKLNRAKRKQQGGVNA